MVKVVCTRYFFDQDIQFITDRLHPSVSFYYPSRTSDIESFLSSHSDVNIYFGPPPNESHLSRNLSSLLLVQIPWSGLDSCKLFDCHRLSIPVANSHSNSSCVAEFSLALALSLIKYIPFHHHSFVSHGLTHRPLSPEGFY
ncbi:hypothetical protein OAE87_01555, partial [bacterium]|nr:hypothetical protein [bacterium]